MEFPFTGIAGVGADGNMKGEIVVSTDGCCSHIASHSSKRKTVNTSKRKKEVIVIESPQLSSVRTITVILYIVLRYSRASPWTQPLPNWYVLPTPLMHPHTHTVPQT